MAETVGSKIKFYFSKTHDEAVALSATEPGSIFFTQYGIFLNGAYYGEPNMTAEEIVAALGTTPVNRATADASGNNIANTYAKKSDIAGLTGAMHFKGVANSVGDTTFSDDLTTSSVKVAGVTFTATSGDVVVQNGLEYVFTGSSWELLGDEGSYLKKTHSFDGLDIQAEANGLILTLGGTAANPTLSFDRQGGSVSQNNDEFVTGGQVYTAISNKVDKESGSRLITSAEITKLSGIATGATKVTVDSSFVANSTNPVQSKVVKSALDGKQASLSAVQLAAVNSGIDADSWTDVSNTVAGLASVASSGNYNDLSNKPTIPAATTIVDNLTSTATGSALSANQGRVLNGKITTLQNRTAMMGDASSGTTIIADAEGNASFKVGSIDSNGVDGVQVERGDLYIGDDVLTAENHTRISDSDVEIKGVSVYNAIVWH